MPSWAFLRDGAGILPASNMADALRAANLGPTDLLVREAVQNSLDERRPDSDGPVRIRFERRVAAGDDKERVVENLDLRALADRRAHFGTAHGWFARGNAVLDEIGNPDVGLPILTISDFGANGLGGRWNRRGSRDDRFFNLVLSIGGSHKWDDGLSARSLGSWGYGKMVFAMSSRIRTIAYYTTFCPDDGAEGARCRAMASGFLPRHSVDGVDYAGQAYFGETSEEERNPRMPLTDAAAHDWARKLGVAGRAGDDTGTTVVILAAEAGMSEIVASCEKWWWPRMRDPDAVRRVRFEFFDEGAAAADFNPRARPELGPFIDCYRVLQSGRGGEKFHLRPVVVQPVGRRRKAGRLALKALDAPNGDAAEGELTNAVALVRDGLVVKYEKRFAHEDKPPVVGVFTPDGDHETMRAFVFSEPPAHDEWEEKSDRLRDEYAWGGDFLRLAKNRLRNETRDFQTRRMDGPVAERTDAGAFLRKSLGRLFRSSGRSSRHSPSRTRAFTIACSASGRRPNGKQLEDWAVFRVGLSDRVSDETATVDVTVALVALADVDGGVGDLVPCLVTSSPGVGEAADKAVVKANLRRDRDFKVEARAKVHPGWKTRWEISVARRDE